MLEYEMNKQNLCLCQQTRNTFHYNYTMKRILMRILLLLLLPNP